MFREELIKYLEKKNTKLVDDDINLGSDKWRFIILDRTNLPLFMLQEIGQMAEANGFIFESIDIHIMENEICIMLWFIFE